MGTRNIYSIGNLDKIERDKVEQSVIRFGLIWSVNSVIKGEPVYKVSADDRWYVLCWVGKRSGRSIFGGAQKVSLELPEGHCRRHCLQCRERRQTTAEWCSISMCTTRLSAKAARKTCPSSPVIMKAL